MIRRVFNSFTFQFVENPLLFALAIGGALLLGGCGINPNAPISSDVNQTITGTANASNSLTLSGTAPLSVSAPRPASGLVLDAQDAMWDLDQAIIIGDLSADDNADKCLHTVLGKYGLDPTVTTPPVVTSATPKSFVPRKGGVLSLGAIAYIKAEQIKNSGPPVIKLPESCGAVVFNLFTFGLQQMASTLPLGLGKNVPQIVLVPDSTIAPLQPVITTPLPAPVISPKPTQ
jgi:hypothetical protein